jgi:hypothetical protein
MLSKKGSEGWPFQLKRGKDSAATISGARMILKTHQVENQILSDHHIISTRRDFFDNIDPFATFVGQARNP